MNRVLLGTTALVAASIMAGGAAAADKVMPGVGGYVTAPLVFASQDDGTGVDLTSGAANDEPGTNRRSHKLWREGEIHIKGSTTLDNGIEAGAQVQLEAETCGDQIDESFIWFSSSFGRFVIGAENSTSYLMLITPGGTNPGLGFSDPTFRHFAIGNDIGANYARKVGTLNFGLSGSWSGANAEATAAGVSAANAEDRDAWGIGGSLSVSGIKLTAALFNDATVFVLGTTIGF